MRRVARCGPARHGWGRERSAGPPSGNQGAGWVIEKAPPDVADLESARSVFRVERVEGRGDLRRDRGAVAHGAHRPRADGPSCSGRSVCRRGPRTRRGRSRRDSRRRPCGPRSRAARKVPTGRARCPGCAASGSCARWSSPGPPTPPPRWPARRSRTPRSRRWVPPAAMADFSCSCRAPANDLMAARPGADTRRQVVVGERRRGAAESDRHYDRGKECAQGSAPVGIFFSVSNPPAARVGNRRWVRRRRRAPGGAVSSRGTGCCSAGAVCLRRSG